MDSKYCCPDIIQIYASSFIGGGQWTFHDEECCESETDVGLGVNVECSHDELRQNVVLIFNLNSAS